MASSTKGGQLRAILITMIILVLVIIASILSVLSHKVPENPPQISGNTPGNLNNNGLFCEYDGSVYFSNVYDHGSLYVMDLYGGDIRKLNENQCYSINAAGNYLYYAMQSSRGGTGLGYLRQTSGIYRCKLNGKDTTSLDSGYAMIMSLCGNYLFAQQEVGKGTGLVRLSLDGEEKTTIANYVLNPACSTNGQIFYNGTKEDHYLYSLDPISTQTGLVLETELWNPVYSDGYVYYMDLKNNYRLCRLTLSGGVPEVLTNDRVDCFNVLGDVVFYQKSSEKEPQLRRMRGDGSDNTLIAEGVFHNINMTSSYTYYMEFGIDDLMYQVSTFGDPTPYPFTQAAAAALN